MTARNHHAKLTVLINRCLAAIVAMAVIHPAPAAADETSARIAMPAAILAASREDGAKLQPDVGVIEFLASLDQQVATAINASLANELLAAIGDLAKTPLAQELRAGDDRIPRLQSPRTLRSRVNQSAIGDMGKSPDHTGADLTALAGQSFGNPQGVAVVARQHLGGTSNFIADVDLRHADGPLAIDVKVTGSQPLTGPQNSRLSYDSSAFIAVLSDIDMGVVARGDLGPLYDPRLGAHQIAGPLARMKLLSGATTLNAETGYNFRLPSAGLAPIDRFHVNINLVMKL